MAGRPWIDAFIESKGTLINRSRELEYFKFGPSEVFKSEENYEIEVTIGELKDTMKISVVDTDIPLLIGLDYQKKWGMVIDVGKNQISLRQSNETFDIPEGQNNHWTLPIQAETFSSQAKYLVFKVDLEGMNAVKLRKHIVRIHKNLAHKSDDQLLKLFRLAGKDSPEVKKVIKSVVQTCNICNRFKKTPARPRIALPKAYTTNEVVSLDLKEMRDYKKQILYMCDEFSGFMAAEVIKNKEPETIIKALSKRWIREGPGIPSKGLFMDNGGEFKNSKLIEVASKLGLSLNFTAAHSPWSNGKNERNHFTCDQTIHKLLEENPRVSLEEAVSHAVEAKNLQITKSGFSPRQLMYGKQGIIPGISEGNPVSMDMAVESDSFRNEFVTRQRAEEIYRRIDSNERLQKCISQRIQGYSDAKYKEGDIVLFKEENKCRWSGPAKVVLMDGNKVQLSFAGSYRTVPTCRVIPFQEDIEIVTEDTLNDVNVDAREDIDITESCHSPTTTTAPPTGEVRPKIRRNIHFKLIGGPSWCTGRVVKVGKQTGKDKFCCWVKCGEEVKKLNFQNDVEAWEYSGISFAKDTKSEDDESKVVTEVMYTGIQNLKCKSVSGLVSTKTNDILVVNIPSKYHDDPKVIEAKNSELEKWDRYEAFEEVAFTGQCVIGPRWVVQEKNEKIKARFVVKGCEEETDPRSDSPTASKESLKLFLTIAANEDFEVKSLDVTSAFLQGYPLKRDVFIHPPPERKRDGYIWKLKKSCYGLYDASRNWFLAVKEALVKMGMRSLSGDDAVFYSIRNGKLEGICLLHVDDFLIGGSEGFLSFALKSLLNRFTFGKIESKKFKFTGLNVEQTEEGIFIDQNEYIQALKPIKFNNFANSDDGVSRSEFLDYRALTGQLAWAADNTRPDISFDARELSTKNKTATYGDLKHANKVLKKAQLEKDVKIRFQKLGDMKSLKIVTFTDSSYRNAENTEKSVGGRVIVLANNAGKCNPLFWKSKTIQQVCKSVKSAETRSLERGMEDSIYLARMVQEIYSGKVSEDQISVDIKIDSKTLHDSLYSSKQVDEKTIRHLIAWIKQQVENKSVDSIKWVCSEEQLADVFTKKNANTESILSVITEGNLH